MSLLIRIETDETLVEFHGPTSPKSVLLGKPTWPIPTLDIHTSSGSLRVEKPFPLFFEEVDYEVLVQNKTSDSRVEVQHRDPGILRHLKEVPNANPSTVIGTVRFRQAIGLSTFSVVTDESVMKITLEVFPAKLDYLDDYFSMVAKIQELDRGLPLRYLEESFQKASPTIQNEPYQVEWLSLLRSMIQQLAKGLRLANQRPLAAHSLRIESLRPHQLRELSATSRRALSRGLGSGGWNRHEGLIAMRDYVAAEQRFESSDLPEHRWLRSSMNAVASQLRALRQSLDSEAQTQRILATKRWTSGLESSNRRLESASREVDELARQVESLQRLPIIADAADSGVPANFSSLRLLRSPGYSDAYRVLSALRMGLTLSPGETEISLDRLGNLYEAWCFVEIVAQLELITSARVLSDLQSVVGRKSLSSSLLGGRETRRTIFLDDGRELVVTYNKRYETLIGGHIPDLEIAIKKPGWPDLIILLDAKYRLDAGPEQLSVHGMPSPPQSAIGALHRYRDAIVIDGSEFGHQEIRPVVCGAALFPLSADESVGYHKSPLFEALNRYGIGAIPFLPGNTDFAQAWLVELLSRSHDQLASLIPPNAREVYRPVEKVGFAVGQEVD